MAITRKQAEQTLEAIAEQFRAHWDWPDATYQPTKPTLIENWDYLSSGPTRWAIVWEEGPFEWALRAGVGGIDEEVAALAAAEVDKDTAAKIATDQPVTIPKGLWLEAVTYWAVGIYE